MFRCEVAYPIFGADRSVLFDGKMGFWPFVEEFAAKYTSKNRSEGTMELKSINVDHESYLEVLVEKVFPIVKKN